MKTIIIDGKIIEISDKSYRKLKKILVKDEFPRNGDRYYCVCSSREVGNFIFSDDNFDQHALAIGNCFKTGKEAKKAVEWLKARAKIIKRIKELNDDWTPNWENGGEDKYFVYYDYNGNEFYVDNCYLVQDLLSIFYCKTEEIANQIIKELEEEYKTYLGVEE